MEVLTSLFDGFATTLLPINLLAALIGVLLGTLTGVLPGLGPSTAMALLLPLSFGLPPETSIILLAGIYYGSMYGGSTTSILVNIPGEAASAVTCIDGHKMALKGRGGAALAVAAIGSFVAGTVGLIGLMFFAPKLAGIALNFGPPEFFAIALLGIIMLSNLSSGGAAKSFLMVLMGMMAATVGMDLITGYQRLTFGSPNMMDGFNLIAVLVGLFGLAEVFSVINTPPQVGNVTKLKMRELYPRKSEIKQSAGPIFRGTLVGFPIGLLPGPASVISSFVSYKLEKSIAKNKSEFGKGAIQGVAGPESSNNAATSAAMIPLFALGLAFTPSVVVLISAFRMQGVIPGPSFITEHSALFWTIIASMYLGNFMLLLLNLPLVGVFASLLKVPTNILMPLVVGLVFIGAYTLTNSIFSIGIALAFGVLGYLLRKAGFDPTPLVIGFVLGPVMEESFRQSLGMFQGDFWQFFMRPLSGTLLVLSILFIIFNIVFKFYEKIKSNRNQEVSNVSIL